MAGPVVTLFYRSHPCNFQPTHIPDLRRTMANKATSILSDNSARYGLVSRGLHWVMAYLLLWQFLVALSWRMFGKGVIVDTFRHLGPSHTTVGMLIILLVIPRGIWAVANRTNRPPYASTLPGQAAKFVHGAFYTLMIVVPALALLRAYGSGKGLILSGWHIVTATGIERPWLNAPANLLHSRLAWLLAVLILGHAVMACIHGFILRDDTLARMAGRLCAQ